MFDLVELREQAGKAAGLDAGLASDDELGRSALALEEARRLIDAAEGHVLAELDGRGVCDREFGMSTQGWLAREANLPAGVARTRVTVGVGLARRFTAVDGALVDGTLGFDHARVIVNAAVPRVADAVADAQDQLIDLAGKLGFEWWRRAVIGVVDLLDADGGHDPADDLARNRLSVSRSFEGTVHLDAKLVGEHGLIVDQAINTKADELFRKFRSDTEQSPELTVPSRPTLRALALTELCRQAQGVDIHSTRSPRPEVVLAVHAGDPTTAATDPNGVQLADGTTRVLLCDPDLHPVVVDSLGVPLDHGTRIRYATPAQRRTIATRDGGCVFPGCDTPPDWCDNHHVQPAVGARQPDGTRSPAGPTSVANMFALCRHHHGITHRTGWTMHTTPDHWAWWQTPAGHTFWSQQHGQQRTGPTPQPPTRTATTTGPDLPDKHPPGHDPPPRE